MIVKLTNHPDCVNELMQYNKPMREKNRNFLGLNSNLDHFGMILIISILSRCCEDDL